MKFKTEKIDPLKKSQKKNLFPATLLGKKKICFKVNKEIDIVEEKKDKSKFITSNYKKGRWSWDEHKKFAEALVKYGIKWKNIKYAIPTRNYEQIRSHAQKFYKKLKLYKNAHLGIDFTSDSIHNIRDMIAHVQSVNANYDIVKIFLYFPKLCEMEKRNLHLEGNNTNIYEHLFDENNQGSFAKDTNKFIKVNHQNKENKNDDNSNYFNISNGMLYLNYINNILNNLGLAIIGYLNNQSIIFNKINLILQNYLRILNKSYINNLK